MSLLFAIMDPPNTYEMDKPLLQGTIRETTPYSSQTRQAPLIKQIQSFRPKLPISRPRRRSCCFGHSFCSFISLIFGLLWMGPAIFFMIWTIQGHVIGASPWCPGTTCGNIGLLHADNDTSNALEAQDIKGRDVLGRLRPGSRQTSYLHT